MNIDNKKCYSCGKVFRTPNDLLRHKNRKTPCLIRDIPEEQKLNPLRCIYCNKILSNKSHLTRHLKICKVKNGGMDILVDKVRYDQEIRILKEQNQQMQQLMEQKDKEKDDQIKQLREEMDQLKKAITVPTTTNNTNNNTINNNHTNNFNAPISITINNYTNPSIDGLTITPAELANAQKLSKFLLQKLFFNPALPQNHCIYLQNRKDKSLVIYDSNDWRMVTGDNLPDVMLRLNNTVTTKGSELINGKNGPYESSDTKFLALPGADQYKIQNFNEYTDTVGNDDAYEVFLGGRDVVLETIRAAGCKLV